MAKEKINFLDNVPVGVMLKYSTPKVGEGNYGTWWMFGAEVYDTTQKAWVDRPLFPTYELYRLMSFAGIETDVPYKITLKQRPDDKKKKYWSVEKNKIEKTTMDIPSDFEFNPPGPIAEPKKQTVVYDESPDATLDDLVMLYVTIWDKVASELVSTQRGLQVNEIRESVSTVYIQAVRMGLHKIKTKPVEPGSISPPPDSDLPF